MCLPYSFDQNMDFQRRLIAENESILSRARPLSELLVEILGRVWDVRGYNDRITYTPNEEYLGNSPPQYEVGHQSHLEIFLNPNNPVQTVKKLNFKGNSPIFPGDTVRAGIFLGEKTKLSPLFILDDYPELRGLVFTGREGMLDLKHNYVWTPREFNAEEDALYLSTRRDGTGGGGRIDFSVNYDPKIHILG